MRHSFGPIGPNNVFVSSNGPNDIGIGPNDTASPNWTKQALDQMNSGQNEPDL